MNRTSFRPSTIFGLVIISIAIMLYASGVLLLRKGAHATTPDWYPDVAIALGAFLMATMFTIGGYKMFCVRLDLIGITQIGFRNGPTWLRAKHIAWGDVTRIQARPGAYRLGDGKETIEIFSYAFLRPKKVLEFISERLTAAGK